MSQSEYFTHFISERGSFLVISITGSLHQMALKDLADFKADVLTRVREKFVVINLLGVDQISGDAISWLAQLQLDIRNESHAMRICLSESSLKTKLMNMGLIRHSEWAESIEKALTSIPPMRKDEKAAVS